MEVTCNCGKVFKTKPNIVKQGKGKFCSKVCMYKYRANRPSGLSYKIVAKNKGWFKKGELVGTPFKKGNVPWNAGTVGLCKPSTTSFTSNNTRGEKNKKWKGDDVGYYALHAWLQRNYKNENICELCGETERVVWASKNYKYRRLRSDWLRLCQKCHSRYDRDNRWGFATRKFKLKRIKK